MLEYNMQQILKTNWNRSKSNSR